MKYRSGLEIRMSFVFSFFFLSKAANASPRLSMLEAGMSYLKEKWDRQRDQHQMQIINPKTWPPPRFLRAAICTSTCLLPETNCDRPTLPAVTSAAFHSFLAEPRVRICAVSLQGGIWFLKPHRAQQQLMQKGRYSPHALRLILETIFYVSYQLTQRDRPDPGWHPLVHSQSWTVRCGHELMLSCPCPLAALNHTNTEMISTLH